MLGFLNAITKATKAVPFVKYALGLSGIVALIALVKSYNLSFEVGIWGTMLVLVLMTILFLLSKSSNNSASFFHQPAKVLIWAMVVIFIIAVALLASCAFFDKPKKLTDLVHPTPEVIVSQPKEITKQFNVYQNGYPLKGVLVIAANIGKSTSSDPSGIVTLRFVADSGLKKLHLNFESPEKNIDTQIDVSLKDFPTEFNLIERKKISPGPIGTKVYSAKSIDTPVMEGYVYFSLQNRVGVENVQVCYPGYCSTTDNNGHFTIKGPSGGIGDEVRVTATTGTVSTSGTRAGVNQKDVIIYLQK